MKLFLATLLTLTFCTACDRPTAATETTPPKVRSLLEERKKFKTTLLRKDHNGEAAPVPPAHLFQLVHYPSPAGNLAAYVGSRPPKGGKHPAIIWLFGGFDSSINELAWFPGRVENDQSASAFREEGLVMMYPSLRGGNDNPGAMETFYGEVDDVLAAADFLAKLDYVDPQRIYLGGHSTGGTLALLTAECSHRFRAIFSFGPVENIAGYGRDVFTFDYKNPREIELRSPGPWLPAIQSPTFVMEGASGRSNIESLRAMARLPHPAAVRFYPVAGANHFSTLAPLTRLIARKILADTGDTTSLQFTEAELSSAVK